MKTSKKISEFEERYFESLHSLYTAYKQWLATAPLDSEFVASVRIENTRSGAEALYGTVNTFPVPSLAPEPPEISRLRPLLSDIRIEDFHPDV